METKKTETAPVTDETPVAKVEKKKGYNLFKNPQDKWELQVDNGRGRIGKTVYESKEDAQSVIDLLGLDKK